MSASHSKHNPFIEPKKTLSCVSSCGQFRRRALQAAALVLSDNQSFARPSLSERVPVMSGESLERRGISCFVGLSVTDLLLTVWLLRSGGGRVYEANPLASWWLGRFGLAGLVGFKAGMVLLVGGLFLLLRHRHGVARRFLAFACAAVALVVLYSLALAAVVEPALRAASQREMAALLAQRSRLSAQLRAVMDFRRRLQGLSRELACGRCGLGEAVAQLKDTEYVRDPAWLRRWRHHWPGVNPRDVLTVQLIQGAVAELRADPLAAAELLSRLGLSRLPLRAMLEWRWRLGQRRAPG